jgi:CBS domain-containing protein
MEMPQTARAERWALVTAQDIMRRQVVTVPYSAPLSEVERILTDHRISGAPVTDEKGHVVGVISMKDLIERYAEDPDARPRRGRGYYHLSSEEMDEEDYDAFEVPEESEDVAGDVMTAEVYSVGPGADLKEIAATMRRHGVHRVLVQERNRTVGLISTMEILDCLSA